MSNVKKAEGKLGVMVVGLFYVLFYIGFRDPPGLIIGGFGQRRKKFLIF